LEAGHAEQSHGPQDSALQNVDRSSDARFAAGHQPVKVGPPHQRASCAQRYRRHDVGPGHDAGVHQDLGILAQLTGYHGQQVEWHRRPIELATTVIGQDNSIDAAIDHGLGIVERLNSLDDELARPFRLDPGQVVEGDAGVEHGVQVLADGARPAIQRRERQRLRGQQVKPPMRVRHRVEDRPQGQCRRDGHPVAHIAQPRPGYRHVDRDQHGVEAGGGGPLHQRHGTVAVLPHVQLKPFAALWSSGDDVFDRAGGQGGQREGDTRRRRCPSSGNFTFGVHQTGKSGGRDTER
jgi:hypothetical protein